MSKLSFRYSSVLFGVAVLAVSFANLMGLIGGG